MWSFIKPMRVFANDCRDTSDKRNRIVHDPWYVDESGRTARHRSMPRGDLTYGIKDHDRQEILDTIEAIKKLADRAEGLRSEIFAQLDA